MCSLTNCSERESVVTPPGLEPGSTGCQTCALTATPKSPAQWHGSQRAYSTVGTITSSHCPHLREAHPCASRTQTSLTHTPIMLLPSRAPHTHKCFTQPWGPSHGVNIPGGPSHNVHGCASDDLTAGHPTSDTICSEGRAGSPYPDSNPGLQGAKHAL